MAKTTTPWTPEEVAALVAGQKAGKSHREIGESLGKTRKAVERKVRQLRQKPVSIEADPTPDRTQFWKARAQDAERKLAAAALEKTATEMLCEEMHALAPKAYVPPVAARKLAPKKGGTTAQSAVLMLSDTHIGAVVKPDQTLGLGEYNFELFLRRLQRLETSIFSILQDHTTTPISELVIPIMGDILEGALVHSAEASQSNTMLEQFYSAGHALAQFLRNLSVLAPLRIYTVVGNHARWQNQHKMPSKNRNSNFDQLLYLYVQALTRDIPSIVWKIDWQPFATFEVQGYPFYALHGDNLRGSDRMLGIPNHALGRMVGTTTQLFSRAKRDIPAYYLVGHLHRGIELPHANGEILVNGAFPGIDGYALGEYFNSSRPMQRFFLMHEKFGVSASYKLRLDLGDAEPHKYELPNQFTCV